MYHSIYVFLIISLCVPKSLSPIYHSIYLTLSNSIYVFLILSLCITLSMYHSGSVFYYPLSMCSSISLSLRHSLLISLS